MSFINEQSEKTFYDNMAAYEQEFGAENVIVIFPKSWIYTNGINPDKFKPMKVQTWEAPMVGLQLTNCEAHFTLPVLG